MPLRQILARTPSYLSEISHFCDFFYFSDFFFLVFQKNQKKKSFWNRDWHRNKESTGFSFLIRNNLWKKCFFIQCFEPAFPKFCFLFYWFEQVNRHFFSNLWKKRFLIYNFESRNQDCCFLVHWFELSKIVSLFLDSDLEEVSLSIRNSESKKFFSRFTVSN